MIRFITAGYSLTLMVVFGAFGILAAARLTNGGLPEHQAIEVITMTEVENRALGALERAEAAQTATRTKLKAATKGEAALDDVGRELLQLSHALRALRDEVAR